MIQSFLPVLPHQPTILILGSMPGVASLSQQEYYAHPRNHFWKIMAFLYNSEETLLDYETKKKLLLQNNIALWDVLEFCERKGSLDIHIKKPIPHDIQKFLNQHPTIQKIIFNGKESYKLFIKHFEIMERFSYHIVPSTSPANTMKFETKLALWQKALL